MSTATQQQQHCADRSPRARGIARLTVHIPSAFRKDVISKANSNDRRPARSRWNTLEFRIYYIVMFFAISFMVWVPVTLSQPSHRNFHMYSPKLWEGWLHGRYIDNSDTQYRSFRDNLGILSKTALGYISVKFFLRNFLLSPSSTTTDANSPSSPTNAEQQQQQHRQQRLHLVPFNVVLSLVMLAALHGASSLKILSIMLVNFAIPTAFRGSRMTPVLTWLFNPIVLFFSVTFHGYPFEDVSTALAFLDSFHGVYARWHVIFNITMLRLISFNMDYYWSCRSSSSEKEPQEEEELDDKQRVSIPHGEEFYSFINYVAYVLYPPLYIGGPIMTFNDFIWQHRRPIQTSIKHKLTYLIRFVICYMTMEYILHFMYVVAIKDTKAWIGDSPAELTMIGFWNLIIVWLKLLIPWRFFRAWALLDGVDPPENMVRCMINNYSTFGFWRSWHRSYNLWIIRYVYIPIGGSKQMLRNTLVVFTFVALWHDLTFRLLTWGWLISLFIVPELLASYILPASKYAKFGWYRHVCALGGVFNMILMAFANLVGFVIGTDGVKFVFGKLIGTWEGVRFMVLFCCCIFVAVQLMFEYRAEELRQGIVRRS